MGEEVERAEGGQGVEQQEHEGEVEKPRGRSKWLWGCGLGCGTILLLIILVVVGVSLWSMSKIKRAQGQMIQALNEDYPKWKEEGIYPKEHQALFDELVSLAQAESSNPTKTGLCFFAVGYASQDGQVDETEIEYAVLVHDFLKEHPDCTWSELGQFFYVNPVLQERVVALTNEYAARTEGGKSPKE